MGQGKEKMLWGLHCLRRPRLWLRMETSSFRRRLDMVDMFRRP